MCNIFGLVSNGLLILPLLEYPFTKSTAVKAGMLRNQFSRSHGVGLADALIAATAKEHGTTVITLNRKHFLMLDHLLVPYDR